MPHTNTTEEVLCNTVEVDGTRYAFPLLFNTDTFGSAVVHVVGMSNPLAVAVDHAIEALAEGSWAWRPAQP